MRRPRIVPNSSPSEILAEIEEETQLHSVIQRDLAEALLAGESTASYRAALTQTGEKIARLRHAHAEAVTRAADLRSMEIAVTAREIATESSQRVVAIFASFAPPPSPI